ncbi:hypothetical protein AAG906_026663 [Vitis piasezkii]
MRICYSEKAEVLKELEFAMVRIAEFRTQAEQAVSMAEMAEKTKAALEEQLRQWQKQRQRRRAALAALRKESVRKENNILKFEQTPATYQPLSKHFNKVKGTSDPSLATDLQAYPPRSIN